MTKPSKEGVFSKRIAQEKKKETRVPELTAEVKELFLKRFTEVKYKEFETMAEGRKLIHIKVDDLLAVLRPPTADDLGEYMMAIAENGMAKAGAQIVDKLWLDGDLDLIQDEDNWCSVFLQMSNLLEGKKGEFFRG
jgi:hypothetical protein